MKINRQDAIFIKDRDVFKKGSNLKHFLKFLKLTGQMIPLKFSYCSDSCSLLMNLTLEENIILSVGNNISDMKKPGYLDEYIMRSRNPFIHTLYQDLKLCCDLSMKPMQLSTRTIKKALLIKTLLQTSEFIILENPEYDIDDFFLSTLKKAIQIEMKNKSKTIILKSEQFEFWKDITTQIVNVTYNKKVTFTCETFRSKSLEIVRDKPEHRQTPDNGTSEDTNDQDKKIAA